MYILIINNFHRPLTADNTSATWFVTLTFLHSLTRTPLVLIRNVERSIPIYFFPYILFSFQTSNFSHILLFSSDPSIKFKSCFSMNFWCFFKLSFEIPIINVLFLLCLFSFSSYAYYESFQYLSFWILFDFLREKLF